MSIGPKCPFASIADLPWCSFFLVLISPNCPFFFNTHLPQCSSFPKCPFGPSAHLPQIAYPFALVLVFLGAHFPQPIFAPNAHLPPMLIGPKVPISQNAHLSQSPHAHLSQTRPICPKCSFAPNALAYMLIRLKPRVREKRGPHHEQ